MSSSRSAVTTGVALLFVMGKENDQSGRADSGGASDLRSYHELMPALVSFCHMQ